MEQQKNQPVAQDDFTLDEFFSMSLDLLCLASAEGYFIKLNEAWKKTLGWSEEELLSKQFFDFIHPDDVEATSQEITKLMEGQEVIAFENRYRHHNGGYRWFRWAAKARSDGLIVAQARDVTEQKKYIFDLSRLLEQTKLAKREARKSEQTYRDLVENQAEFVTRFLPDMRLTYVNKSACRFINKTAKELTGEKWLNFVCPEHHADVLTALSELTASKPLVKYDSIHVETEEKPFAHIVWTVRAFFDQGEVTHYQAIGHDITIEKQKLEVEHEKQKFEALGQFVGGVAQELDLNLRPVKTLLLELENMGNIAPDVLKTYMENVGHHTKTMQKIIDDVLLFAAIDQEDRNVRQYHLSALMKDAVDNVLEILPETVRVIKFFDENISSEMVGALTALNKPQFYQVVSTFITSASMAMQDRGRIIVDVQPVRIEEGVIIEGLSKGHYAEIGIHDEAPPITEEELPFVFEPFSVTNPFQEYNSLPLAVAYSLVKKWGGAVKVEPKPDTGNVFKIYVPLITSENMS